MTPSPPILRIPPHSANPNPGWYTGDFPATARWNPVNLNQRTMILGSATSPAGNGLDLRTIVGQQHNSARVLGAPVQLPRQADHSGSRSPRTTATPGTPIYSRRIPGSGSAPDVLLGRRNSRRPSRPTANSDGSPRRSSPLAVFQPVLDGGGYTVSITRRSTKAPAGPAPGCAWNYRRADRLLKVTALELRPARVCGERAFGDAMNRKARSTYYRHTSGCDRCGWFHRRGSAP